MDLLTAEEKRAFMDLNEQYMGKFGFPFIVAVRDYDKAQILQLFNQRLQNSRDQEFREACRQVERIAELRLQSMEI